MRTVVSVFLLGSIALPFLTANANAGIAIVSQTRTVSANAQVFGPGNESDSESVTHTAPDDGPFDEGAGATATTSGGDCLAGANQISTLGANELHAIGNCGMYAEAFNAQAFASCHAASVFDVTFEVSVASPFTLSGFLSGYDFGNSTIEFTGPDGTLYDVTTFNEEVTFHETGTLEAGEYRLFARSNGSASAGLETSYASGDYNVTLAVAGSVSVDPATWAQIKGAYR
jgi:hypothetical protein